MIFARRSLTTPRQISLDKTIKVCNDVNIINQAGFKNQTSKINKGPVTSRAPCMVELPLQVTGSFFAFEVIPMNEEITQRLKSIQDHIDLISYREYPPSYETTKHEVLMLLKERKAMLELFYGE